jgi:hypothetical protein
MKLPFVLAATCLLLIGCRPRQADIAPSISFTRVPPADKGGPDTRDTIEGRVVGAKPGQAIVLFNRSGVWWVQPEARAYTEVQADSASALHISGRVRGAAGE